MHFGTSLVRSSLFAMLVVVGPLLAGFAWNASTIRHERDVVGVPGKLYRVDGYAMHLYCTGTGSPAIVLDAGLGDDFTVWAPVQPVLARRTRVCAYDRAGFGWSDARPGVRDADAISSELHELVAVAGVRRPFVLSVHSIAGIYARDYAARYRRDLAGLVLIDGATPLQDERVPKALVEIQQRQRRELPWQKFLMTIGWDRMRGICAVPPGLAAYEGWVEADTCIPSQIDAIEHELDAEHRSGLETARAGPFGALPVLILSRDPNSRPSNLPRPVTEANAIVWNRMQEEAKRLSSQSRRIIARGSDHYVQNDRTNLVDRRLAAFLDMVRRHATFPNDRATTTE